MSWPTGSWGRGSRRPGSTPPSSPRTPATPTSAARTRFSWPTRSTAPPPPSARRPTGRPSGRGTASGPRSAGALPDGTVLDGEILPWKDGGVRPFADLQKRIGRKTLSKKLLDEVPVCLMAYDLIEEAGSDLRERSLADRRPALEALVGRVAH